MYEDHAQGTRRRSRTTATVTAWALVLLGLGVLLAPSAGAAAGSTNAAAQIPQAYGGALSAVSCPSATVCVAVGTQRSTTGAAQAFAEVRHGSTVWTLTSPVPTPVNARQTSLAAVSCPSAGSCMAVGTYHDAYDDQRPFAASWNGSTWTVRSVPVRSGATAESLAGVSCWSTTGCLAVGASTPVHTAALRWNGSTWTPTSTPADDGHLFGVSCPTAGFCAAVGDGPSALEWNGSTWRTSAVQPPPSSDDYPVLNGVSCVSPTACRAVGSYVFDDEHVATYPLPLAEHWDGVSWTYRAVPSPREGAQPDLLGIDCVSAASCQAVGADPAEGTLQVARWNGSTWTAVQSSAVAGSDSAELASVACVSASECVAVGSATGHTDVGLDTPTRTLAQRWTGSTWTVQNTVNAPGATESALLDVSCATPTSCVAVGFSNGTDNHGRTLVEAWNGTTWTTQPSPTPTPSDRYVALSSVSCTAASSCVAVGEATGLQGSSTGFSEVWNGRTWALVPIPTIVPTAVSCTSATSCLAVGSAPDAAAGQPAVARRWNGTTWSPAPALPASATGVRDVSCAGTTCTAVGTTGTAAFAVSLTGATWTSSTLPAAGGLPIEPHSVSCVAARSCTTVGQATGSDGTPYAYAAVLSGSAWTRQQVPDVGYLIGVSCSDATHCTAAGRTATGTGPNTDQVALARTGSMWRVVPLPQPADTDSTEANAVSCTSATACVVVGDYNVPDAGFLSVPYAVAAPGPTPPTRVTAAVTGPGRVTVTWSSPTTPGATPVTGYRLSRNGVDASGHGAYATIVAATDRSFTFTSLEPGAVYNLTVQAVTATGTGAPATVTVTVPAS